MTKFRIFFLMAAAVVAGVMTSCSKDDTNPIPSVSFTGSGISSDNQVACSGSAYSLAATLKASAKFSSITMTVATGTNFSSTATTTITGYASKDTVYNYANSIAISGATKVTISITDKDNQTASETLTIYPISSYTAVLMGGATNTTYGSFFASTTGSVLTTTQANNSQSSVDLIFTYSGEGSGNLFAGPSDSQISAAFSGITSWTVKNATKFSAVGISTTDFANANIFSSFSTSDAAYTRVSNLNVNDVFGFITASGKQGLVQVNAINGSTGTDRSITINVKVVK